MNWIYRPDPLDKAETNEAMYALALWHVYHQLGFDTDGDTHPRATIAGMGPQGYAQMIIDSAREHANDYDELINRVPEEYL